MGKEFWGWKMENTQIDYVKKQRKKLAAIRSLCVFYFPTRLSGSPTRDRQTYQEILFVFIF